MRNLFVIVAALMFVISGGVANALTIGALGSKPTKEIKKLKPVAAYLEAKLGEKVNIVVLPTPEKMAEKIKAKEVDFFMDSPFPAANICNLSGARYALRHWKKGVAEYNGCVFTVKGKVASVADLKGKMIALEDPDSTSSFLLPSLIMLGEGLKMTAKKNFKSEVAADEVGYVFSGADENTIVWVERGRVAGGGIKTSEVKGNDKLTILKEGAFVPRAVVCFGGHVDAAMEKTISDVLSGMDKDAEGQAVLKGFSKTKRFDAFPGSAADVQAKMFGMFKEAQAIVK